MSTVLIVDDSAVDRRLVGGLLTKNGGYRVEYATNGGEALDKMATMLPDLVLTDMLMPEMDGLQLVGTIHDRYPLVPVILITSRGSEELAVQALQRGASSYVPKRAVAQELLPTVESVLSMSHQRRCHARLMASLSHFHSKFVVESDASLVAPLVSYLQDHAGLVGLNDDADRVRIGVALAEAITNALYHGNLEISSELRERDDQAYQDLVQRRRREQPYCDRRIHVESKITQTEAIWTVRDEGPGFDPHSLADPTDPANFERVSGRGLLLIRTFMDEVVHNEKGNEVMLIKRLKPAKRPAADAVA